MPEGDKHILESDAVLPRRRLSGDDELDITPMIDCVFLLLIFFMVTSTPDLQTALDLPPAHYGIGVTERDAVIFAIADSGNPRAPLVFVGADKGGQQLPQDAAQQEQAIRRAVESAFVEGKREVLIKAERGVHHRQVARIAAVTSSIEGMRLNLAVMEED